MSRVGSATYRLEKRREARRALAELFRQPDNLSVIHYSCEGFYDRTSGTSPRITSIAVRDVGSRQTTSFSIHQVAERLRIAPAELEPQYDELERTMLDAFYEYLGKRLKHRWVHWNMRDTNYGFLAIAHRYRVLRGKPIELNEANLFDLSSALSDIYGPH